MSARTAYVDGVALWAPRLPGWDASLSVLRGEAPAPEAASPRPAPALLAPTERRRAPDTVAIALEVASRACEMAVADPKRLPAVFASAHGDLAINDYMCATLAQAPLTISPTKFHNSVHNAAAGYWTIGTGCMQGSTALTAFEHTFGQGLLEALSQVAADERDVLYVAYDIEARGPMATVADSRALYACAFVLAAAPGPRSRAVLRWKAREGASPATPARNAALVAGSPIAASLHLVEALALAQPAAFAVPLADALALDLALEPAARASEAAREGEAVLP